LIPRTSKKSREKTKRHIKKEVLAAASLGLGALSLGPRKAKTLRVFLGFFADLDFNHTLLHL
jgi:hypothetical protein